MGEFVWKIGEDCELPLDHALGFDVRSPESKSVHGEVVRLDAMYERYDIIDEFLFIGYWRLDTRVVVMYEFFGVRHIYCRSSGGSTLFVSAPIDYIQLGVRVVWLSLILISSLLCSTKCRDVRADAI